MGCSGPMKVLLYIMNTIFILLGGAIAATSLWFFVQVHEFTSLRNENHYRLDYNVYWPQAVPWMFFVLGILVLIVSCCGFTSAKKNRKSFLTMYIVSIGMIVLLLIAAAVIALIFTDSKSSTQFIKDTIWDAFTSVKDSANNPLNPIVQAYSNIEKKLTCCGAESPRDYKNANRQSFPMSCCDTYHYGWFGSDNLNYECDFSSKMPNERLGCISVAVQYASIIVKVLSGASILTAFVGIINIIFALTLRKSLKRKPRVVQELSDSKKGLL